MKKTEQRDLFPGALEMMILRILRRKPSHGYALVQHIKGTYDTLPIIRTFPRESRLSVLVIRSKVNHSLFLGPSIGTVDCISF